MALYSRRDLSGGFGPGAALAQASTSDIVSRGHVNPGRGGAGRVNPASNTGLTFSTEGEAATLPERNRAGSRADHRPARARLRGRLRNGAA